MTQPFALAACAETLWRDKPIDWRASRLGEVQAADNPGRCDREPGRSTMRASRALRDMGYKGAVGMESFAAGDPEAALAAFRAAFTL
jgi:hydroxypyruvate isomerase